MGVTIGRRQRQLILVVILSLTAVLSGVRLIEYGTSAWRWVPVYAVVGFVLVGPLAWLIRDRVPPARRETLTYVVAGVAFLAFVVLFGIWLAFEVALPYFDAVVVGGIVGTAVVMVLERTVVPERLTAPAPSGTEE